MPTCSLASFDVDEAGGPAAPDRVLAVRAQLDDIADRVLRIGLLGGGLVSQLPERSRGTALHHLEELDAVIAALRAVIVDVSSTD